MTLLNLKHAAALLGGQVVQQCVLCPGPGHSRHDRSLSVSFREGGIIVHSYAGDDWRTCKDYVRDKLGLGDRDCQETNLNLLPPQVINPSASDAGRVARAAAIWRAAVPIIGTPAELYLTSRGLSYSGDALRWHPNCPFGPDRLGCMVALVRSIVTNAPQAIHRTAIDTSGRKLSHLGANGRLSFGPVAGGAVKLTDDMDVSSVIATGEGIETTLSIRQLPDLRSMPVWSVLTAGGLAAFPILPGIETVWLAADNDASGTGQRAARQLGQRLTAAGIEAIVLSTTQVGSDLNDKVAGHGVA